MVATTQVVRDEVELEDALVREATWGVVEVCNISRQTFL
jgi:hypothetical protein